MQRRLQESFDRQDNLTDATVTLAGEEQVRVHKVVLRAVSDVLRAAFDQSNASTIRCETYTAKEMKNFIRYMYTDKLEYDTIEDLLEYLQMADFYAVDDLKDFCCSTLLVKCREQPRRLLIPFLNVLTRLNVDDVMIDSCLDVYDTSAWDILSNDSCLEQFVRLSVATVSNILSRNAFIPETILLRTLIAYVKTLDNESRLARTQELCKKINFFCIPREVLVELLLRNDFLRNFVPISAFSSLPPSLGDVIVNGQPICCISREIRYPQHVIPAKRFIRDVHSQWRGNEFHGDRITFEVRQTVQLLGFEVFIANDSCVKFMLTVLNRRERQLAQTEHTCFPNAARVKATVLLQSPLRLVNHDRYTAVLQMHGGSPSAYGEMGLKSLKITHLDVAVKFLNSEAANGTCTETGQFPVLLFRKV